MGRFLSRGFASAAHLFLLHRFFVRSHSRFFVPTRPLLTAARTGAVRVGRRTTLSACSALARPYLDGSDTTARLTRSGRRSEGGLPSGADHRAATLYSVGPGGPDHDAVMRIGGEAPRRRTHSRNRCQHHGLLRVTATSDRHRMPTKSCSSGSERLVLSEFSPHAARNTTPAGTSPVVTRRHRAISNFRARATIIVLRFLPPLSVRVRYHWANALSFWKSKKRQAN